MNAIVVTLLMLTGGDVLEANKRLVRGIYEEAINTGRLELLETRLAPDLHASFRANVEELRTGFPDILFTVEDLVAEGDRVVVRWRWTATHAGPFRQHPPTGRKVENTGIVIYQLRDGKAVRAWLEIDRLGVLQQMGAVK
jgi:predicted ester cyclase